MKLIAITHPSFFKEEGRKITELLESGKFWRMHLRKPGSTEVEMRQLITEIPQYLYDRLSIHDHFTLAEEFGLGGIHLNSRNPLKPEGWKGVTSRSIHTVDEIDSVVDDYAFLSPIFPSISKPGYKGTFSEVELCNHVNSKIFALGGITPDKLAIVEQLGFGGAAMLGAVWRPTVNMEQFKLQFITHTTNCFGVVEGAELALKGGCRWIQLRHKGANNETLIFEGERLRKLCSLYNASFIIDDHVELVDLLGADGVHLGKNDMSVDEARKILGPGKIIGATANSAADIIDAAKAGANYIGLGPFRFTTTKEKLSPILGIDGYCNIINDCKEQGICLPIVAIGGITPDDIPNLIPTGINGIAVSSTILSAENPITETQTLLQKLTKH